MLQRNGSKLTSQQLLLLDETPLTEKFWTKKGRHVMISAITGGTPQNLQSWPTILDC